MTPHARQSVMSMTTLGRTTLFALPKCTVLVVKASVPLVSLKSISSGPALLAD